MIWNSGFVLISMIILIYQSSDEDRMELTQIGEQVYAAEKIEQKRVRKVLIHRTII